MIITIEVMGWLKKYTDKDRFDLEVEQGAKLKDILGRTGIPSDEIGFVIVVSKTTGVQTLVRDEMVVAEGDILKLYSTIVGG